MCWMKLLTVLLLAGSLAAGEALGPGVHNDLAVDGAPGAFVNLYLPSTYGTAEGRLYPVLFLHINSGKPPVGPKKNWAEANQVILVGVGGAKAGPSAPIAKVQAAVVAWLEKNVKISHALRYSTGHSGAAQMSWLLAQIYPDKHAGVLMTGQAGFNPLPKHVALAFIHGEEEENIPWINAQIAAANSKGNPVKRMQIPGGHVAGSGAQQAEMLDWLLDQTFLSHPKLAKEERERNAQIVVERWAALGSIADLAARRAAADRLLLLPGATRFKHFKEWRQAWLEVFTAHVESLEPLDRIVELQRLETDPLIKLGGGDAAKLVRDQVRSLCKDKEIKREYAAQTMLSKIREAAEKAQTSTQKAQVKAGYESLVKKYGGTRAASEAERILK